MSVLPLVQHADSTAQQQADRRLQDVTADTEAAFSHAVPTSAVGLISVNGMYVCISICDILI